MKQLLQIFSCLERKHELSLHMDPNLPAVDESGFSHDASFVDASHTADKVTWRSHSRHIPFVDGAPVDSEWHSKRQTAVETGAFLLEFAVMKHCIEDIECLRFKLRMFGIPLNKNKPETRILCDNQAVVKISSNVESKLNEKHSAVAHHFARGNVTAKVCLVGWIPTRENIADAVTKSLPEAKHDELFHNWVF